MIDSCLSSTFRAIQHQPLSNTELEIESFLSDSKEEINISSDIICKFSIFWKSSRSTNILALIINCGSTASLCLLGPEGLIVCCLLLTELHVKDSFVCICEAWTFISLQIKEFRIMGLSINDSVYSCLFFILTGLHFFHLLVGLLLSCLFFWSCSFSFLSCESFFFIIRICY